MGLEPDIASVKNLYPNLLDDSAINESRNFISFFIFYKYYTIIFNFCQLVEFLKFFMGFLLVLISETGNFSFRIQKSSD